MPATASQFPSSRFFPSNSFWNTLRPRETASLRTLPRPTFLIHCLLRTLGFSPGRPTSCTETRPDERGFSPHPSITHSNAPPPSAHTQRGVVSGRGFENDSLAHPAVSLSRMASTNGYFLGGSFVMQYLYRRICSR